jgi:hypothetical protein
MLAKFQNIHFPKTAFWRAENIFYRSLNRPQVFLPYMEFWSGDQLNQGNLSDTFRWGA